MNQPQRRFAWRGPAEEEIVVVLAGELGADLVAVAPGGRGRWSAWPLGASRRRSRAPRLPAATDGRGRRPFGSGGTGWGRGPAHRRALRRVGAAGAGFPSPASFAHARASRARVSETMFGEGGELLLERVTRPEDLLGEWPSIKVFAWDAATIIREAAGEGEEPALVAVGSRSLDALRHWVASPRASSGPSTAPSWSSPDWVPRSEHSPGEDRAGHRRRWRSERSE